MIIVVLKVTCISFFVTDICCIALLRIENILYGMPRKHRTEPYVDTEVNCLSSGHHASQKTFRESKKRGSSVPAARQRIRVPDLRCDRLSEPPRSSIGRIVDPHVLSKFV